MWISCVCVIRTETIRRRFVRRAPSRRRAVANQILLSVSFFSRPRKRKRKRSRGRKRAFDASDDAGLPTRKTGELSVYRRNPASVGVRGSRDARRRRRAPILARHPRVCAVRGDRRRRRARSRVERARRRGSTRRGNVLRWRILNGRSRESSFAPRRRARAGMCVSFRRVVVKIVHHWLVLRRPQ